MVLQPESPWARMGAEGLQPWTPSEADRSAYTGHYFSEELQTLYTVVEVGRDLAVYHRRMENITLTPTAQDTFTGTFPIGEIVFLRDATGRVTGLSVSLGRTRGVHFDKCGTH